MIGGVCILTVQTVIWDLFQPTSRQLYLFPVVIFSSCNWCVRILTRQMVIWDSFQPTVRRLYLFSGCNFFWWFKKHSQPDNCTFFFRSQFFRVVIGACILTRTPITYVRKKLLPEKKGTAVWPAMFFGGLKFQPEKIMTGKKGTVVWPTVEINLR